MAFDASVGSPEPAQPVATPAAEGLPSGTIARVNGVLLTQVRLEDELSTLPAPPSDSQRSALKNQLIAEELFRQDALRLHYDQNPEVEAADTGSKTTVMNDVYLEHEIALRPITQSEIRARYDAWVAAMGPRQYHVRVMAVASAAEARTLIYALHHGADFARLARRRSVGPAAAEGGLMRWMSFRQPLAEGDPQGIPVAFARAVASLQPGDVAPEPVQVQARYWVIRLEAVRPTRIPGPEESEAALRAQLTREMVRGGVTQRLDELLRNADIQE